MLKELYNAISTPSILGRDMVLPEFTSDIAMYISEKGEVYCYLGFLLNNRTDFHRPYIYPGKHSYDSGINFRALYRLKSGCLLLSPFLDNIQFENESFKRIERVYARFDKIQKFYGIFFNGEHDECLTRECFGLACEELDYLLDVCADTIGYYGDYYKFPRLTSSNYFNFCDLTNILIPEKFPYITLDVDGSKSHVSIFGFLKHMQVLFSLYNNDLYRKLQQDERGKGIIRMIVNLDDHFYYDVEATEKVINLKDYFKIYYSGTDVVERYSTEVSSIQHMIYKLRSGDVFEVSKKKKDGLLRTHARKIDNEYNLLLHKMRNDAISTQEELEKQKTLK